MCLYLDLPLLSYLGKNLFVRQLARIRIFNKCMYALNHVCLYCKDAWLSTPLMLLLTAVSHTLRSLYIVPHRY